MQHMLQHEASGRVTVNEHMPSQRFHRFVDEKIRDWMEAHQLTGRPLDYDVAFFDEDPLGEVSCLIVINASGHLWRAWETADNPRVALSRSIENLRMETMEQFLYQNGESHSVYQ